MERKYIITLEISGTQVKGVLASVPADEPRSRHKLTVEAIATRDIADCVRNGRVQNIANAKAYTLQVIRELQNNPAIEDGTIEGCYAALGGRSMHSEKTSAKITLPAKSIITERDVRRLFDEAAKNAPNTMSVVKVLPRRLFVDGIEQEPVGVMGTELRGEFTLVLCDPANRHNLEMVIDGKCQLPVFDCIPTPIAQGCLLLDKEERQKGCMLVDIGAQTITVAIYKELALQYLATLPMGSHNITRDISIGTSITVEKAEITKCALGNAMPDANRPKDESYRINTYVNARAIELAANIAASIRYAEYNRNDLTGGIVVCGRGVRLRNFDRLIGEQCKMPVRRAVLPKSIDVSALDPSENVADFLSILTVTDLVSRRRNFTPSVEFNDEYEDDFEEPGTIVIPETEEVTQAPQKPVAPQQPVAEEPAPEVPARQPEVTVETQPETPAEIPAPVEEPEPGPAPQPPTTTTDGGGKPRDLLNKIKEQWTKLVTGETLDGDASL